MAKRWTDQWRNWTTIHAALYSLTIITKGSRN